MLDKVKETIIKYDLIRPEDKIVLGVSGGPDSTAMLICLNELSKEMNFKIAVCHINHGIRENAKLDEEYVKRLCKELNVPCFVLHANVIEEAKKQKRGIEETGRIIRYNFFEEVMQKENFNKIAIAHNKNDNVETIIMNVLRGSGTSGLKGIEPKSGKYIRPLIEIPREEIEKFTSKYNPRHDESNDENEYTRNKIRNIVIPYVKKEFNPNIVETITRLSSISKEETEYLDKITEIAYKKICIEEVYNELNKPTIILDLKSFNLEDTIIQKRLVLYSIKKIFGSTKGIEKVHIEDIIKLCNNNIGNKYLTPNKNTKIVIKNKKIYIMSVK